MAAHAKRPTASPSRSREARRPSVATAKPWAAFPVVALCSVAVAACVLFGNPVLWVANDQIEAEATPSNPAQNNQVSPAVPLQTAPENGENVIGSYKAISQGSDENRAENIRLSAEAIDGYVIEPGATFSFNTVVGDTGSDDRYRVAAIISDDETVQGRGGGICQVSTALYIAALKADLDIIERHAHTVVPDYAPIGLDATLSYGELDLRIRNSETSPVTIHAKVLGQTVEVWLTGEKHAEGETIDATSKITDRYEETGPNGTKEQYYVAESFRVYYENGVKTGSVLLSTDTYKVADTTTVMLAEGSVDPSK